MMAILVFDHTSSQNPNMDVSKLTDILDSVYTYLNLPKGNLEITMLDESEITELNRNYRNNPKPANVLSFPHFTWSAPCTCDEQALHRPDACSLITWGEVMVGVETVRKDAERQKTDFTMELIRVCIHGMLHVFGYDHQEETAYSIMSEKETAAIEFALKRILRNGT